MQKHWLTRRPGNKHLLLVALGWAGSPAASPPTPPGYDALCLYDYRALEQLDPGVYAAYEHLDLAAWSFGVMVAERVARGLPLRRKLAFNGSPKPVDDHFGIPVRSFLVTLKGLRRAGTDLFFERVYGGSGRVPAAHLPERTLEELVAELEVLYETSQKPVPDEFSWDAAFIGKRDAIFPPKNLQAYWRSKGRLFDGPHYPFDDTSLLASALI